jgi:hypothetical protein
MGVGGSKQQMATIGDPFPIDLRLSKDLDKLSYVAARILSTPDIYDVNNLAKPGVCGDYAVFLKKGLEKKLLPFIGDVKGTLQEVVYQNPRKSISDLETRKQICSQMVETMLRAIATVVACLASIQVKSHEKAVEGVPKQADVGVQRGGLQNGGNITSIRDWFQQAGYISATNAAKPSGSFMVFQNPGIPASPKYQYKLKLERTEGNLTYGLISVDSKPGIPDALQPGSLRVQFLNQVAMPVPGSNVSVLPMRIVDDAGITWIAGVFYNNTFKSFADTGNIYITDFLERLFRRSAGADDIMIESRDKITEANLVFQNLRRTQNPQVVLQALSRWLPSAIPGFQAGYQPVPYGLPQAPYGQPYGLPPPYGAPPAAAPYGLPYGAQQPLVPYRPPTAYGVGTMPGTVSLRPVTGDMSYDIPINATKGIMDAFKHFRELLPKESSPAAARAASLSGLENRDRTVQTHVCSDPYWKEPTLKNIYPWATLQFLSIKEWKSLAEDRSKPNIFEDEWTDFLEKLGGIYSSTERPTLERPNGAKFLDQMRFTKANELELCKPSTNPSVRFKEVQGALSELQALYDSHVKKTWNLLNSLIYLIEDPDTKVEVVRLHPNVISAKSGMSSEKYVKEKAKEARRLIADFYIGVERIYSRAVKSLVKA